MHPDGIIKKSILISFLVIKKHSEELIMGGIKEQWHPPFYCSYEMDFRKYKDMLQIDTGYILERSSEIDILTVKKKKDAVIDNGLGSIYREYNIIEYKSPDDRIDMSAWLQAMGYAFLYMRLENIRSFKRILVSLMGYNYPRKLIKELKELGYTEAQVEEGILFFTNPINIDVQIVIISEIEDEKYPWISLIKKRISEDRINNISNQLRDVEDDRVYIAKAREVTDLVVRRLIQNGQREELNKMNETRDLFKAEFEAKDREIEKLKEELKNEKNQNEKLMERVMSLESKMNYK